MLIIFHLLYEILAIGICLLFSISMLVCRCSGTVCKKYVPVCIWFLIGFV